MGGLKELIVFRKAYELAIDIQIQTKTFPTEEKYSLTDQIRRSSRSVCVNLAEAYRRRKYKAHFISKLSDAGAENAETDVWINFAADFKYWPPATSKNLLLKNDEVGKLISYMINNPDKFL